MDEKTSPLIQDLDEVKKSGRPKEKPKPVVKKGFLHGGKGKKAPRLYDDAGSSGDGVKEVKRGDRTGRRLVPFVTPCAAQAPVTAPALIVAGGLLEINGKVQGGGHVNNVAGRAESCHGKTCREWGCSGRAARGHARGHAGCKGD